MESLFTIFLLFVAAIVAILTYMYVPYMPIVALTSASAIALAAGMWWHWTQFAEDYERSTWPNQLRKYASYVMVAIVLLVSYGFYVLVYNGSSLQELASRTVSSARNAGSRATSAISSGVSRVQSALTEEASAPAPAPYVNRNAGRNRSANFLS